MKSDYQCESCGAVFEWEKPFGESFPPTRPCQCGAHAKRLYSPFVSAIAEGNNGITYHPSTFTPGGKKRRKRIT